MARPQARGPRDPPSVSWTLACMRVSGQPESGLVRVCFLYWCGTPLPQSSPQGLCSSCPTFRGSLRALGGQVGWGLCRRAPSTLGEAAKPLLGGLGRPGLQVLEPFKKH